MQFIALRKDLFFDSEKVLRALDKATRKNLQTGAKYIRRRAQTSMRYVHESKADPTARDTSAPGKPPKAVREHPWLRKFIYYHYDPDTQTAIVGPLGFRRGGAPSTMEFGGRAKIRNKRRRRRTIGGPGEVRIRALGGRSTKPAIDRHGRTVPVTYAPIRTAAQAARANQLNEDLYGPEAAAVTIAARPYMAPALDAEADNLAKLWAGTVK